MLSAIRTSIRTVGHADELSTVDHLDELRTRMIVSIAVIAVAFGFAFWQNHALLHLINEPLSRQTQGAVRAGHGPLGATYTVALSARDVALQVERVVQVVDRSGAANKAVAAPLRAVERALQRDASRLAVPPAGDKPVTLGIAEPFTATLTVTLVFALILSLPIVLYQAYAFLIPALEPRHRRAVRPLLAAVPLLFCTGVAFGYVVVLPAAVHFLQNFNSSEFTVLVQAGQYYGFATTTLLAMGVLFQVPVGIVTIVRAGILSAAQFRRNRRYAVAACAAVAALLPGDAVTMLLETVPLYLLFEVGVLLAAIVERRAGRRAVQVG
jgi:sec-independent protein translocase protein TatC